MPMQQLVGIMWTVVLLAAALFALCGYGVTGSVWLLVAGIALVLLEQLRCGMAREGERMQDQMDAVLGPALTDVEGLRFDHRNGDGGCGGCGPESQPEFQRRGVQRDR